MYNKTKSSILKKFIRVTITSLLLFGMLHSTLALEWYSEEYVERLLDINYWVERYDLELANIEDVYFYTTSFRNMFED